jgi:hypothetical protein
MKEPETLPETWRALIRWLADTYHHGALYPMAARVGVSSGVIDQWEKGVVKTPSYAPPALRCPAGGAAHPDAAAAAAEGAHAPSYPWGLRPGRSPTERACCGHVASYQTSPAPACPYLGAPGGTTYRARRLILVSEPAI